MEASGDSRGIDSFCRGACVVGLDGDCCAGCRPSDAAGAIRVLCSRGSNRASRLSVLDGDLRADSGLRAMARGVPQAYTLSGGLTAYRNTAWFARGLPSIEEALFLFVLGIAAITLFTKRPMVEALPAAGISASGLILVAFPLSFAIRVHGAGTQG